MSLSDKQLKCVRAIEQGYIRSPEIAQFLGITVNATLRSLRILVKNRIIDCTLGEDLKRRGLIKIYFIREGSKY